MARPPKPPKKGKKRKGRKKKKKAVIVKTAAVILDKAALTRIAIFRAFHVYMRNPGLSVRQVWESGIMSEEENSIPIRDCCGLDYLIKVAQKDKWRSRRQEFWQDIRAKVMEHAQNEMVQREIVEMTDLEAARGTAMAHITGTGEHEAVKPKSLEGAIGALVQLDKRIGDKRKRIAADASEAAGRMDATTEGRAVGAIPVIEDGYNDDEIEAMARTIAITRARTKDEE
tara:strand:- start:104 stop:787 length:684 start_codon:yes stop_codon:yes gene_type:complete